MKLSIRLKDFFFPPKCPFCGSFHPYEAPDGTLGPCEACQKDLPWLIGPQSEQKVEFLSLCVSPLLYQDKVKGAFHRYKFQGALNFAPSFGTLMAQCAKDRLPLAAIDWVTWAPLSPLRRRFRGYDQARLLAQRVAELTDLPLVPTLEKVRHTRAQSSLTGDKKDRRRANVLGAYRLAKDTDVRGKRLLLIDDVVTTGSTLSECARILRTAGAAEVWGCTFAWARGHK